MGVILKFPPAIKHIGDRPEQEKQSLILNRALFNLRVPKAASRLMVFYAAQATGFRPSLKVIESATGIASHNISRVRQLLVAYGLIGYDQTYIIVDWVRLRGLAIADVKRIGAKRDWRISPVSASSSSDSTFDVHNYIGTLNSADRRLYNSYAATATALVDGIRFPELSDMEIPTIDLELLKDSTFGVHNYIGNETLSGWYNPFDEPDPEWIYQIPYVDAYGEIVGYAHYDTILPF